MSKVFGIRTVWKFELPHRHGVYMLGMPKGAAIIKCDCQHGALRLWAIAKPCEESVGRNFAVMHTGAPLEARCDASNHIASVLMEEGHYVVHVFEV